MADYQARVGFWEALRGTCCGTEIFFRLRKNSTLRILFHLFFMALLCSAGILLGQLNRLLPEVRQLEQVFIAEFGSEFQLSAAGIVPEKAPERARALSLPFDGKLFYVPRGEAGVRLPSEQAEFLNYLAVWSPGYFVSAQHYEKDSWLVSILRPAEEGGAISMFSPEKHYLTNSGLVELLDSKLDNGYSWPVKETATQSFTALFGSLKIGMGILLFGMQLVGILALALFYTGLFAGMFRLTSSRRLQTLTFGEFWKIGVYAGFPVMLVASCFPAFDLPYLSYSTVFMIGLVVYWLVAVARVERAGVSGSQEG